MPGPTFRMLRRQHEAEDAGDGLAERHLHAFYRKNMTKRSPVSPGTGDRVHPFPQWFRLSDYRLLP